MKDTLDTSVLTVRERKERKQSKGKLVRMFMSKIITGTLGRLGKKIDSVKKKNLKEKFFFEFIEKMSKFIKKLGKKIGPLKS